MDKLTILPTRQIQITREDVAGIDGCPQILATVRVTVPFGPPILAAVSEFMIRFLAAQGRRIEAASENYPILFPIANAIVTVASIMVARIVVEHR